MSSRRVHPRVAHLDDALAARRLLPPVLVLPLVFVVGAVIAFSTGTSWGTFAIMIPVLAISMQQLHTVGKMSPRELEMMATVFAVALLGGVIAIALRYFARLAPQRRRRWTMWLHGASIS